MDYGATQQVDDDEEDAKMPAFQLVEVCGRGMMPPYTPKPGGRAYTVLDGENSVGTVRAALLRRPRTCASGHNALAPPPLPLVCSRARAFA